MEHEVKVIAIVKEDQKLLLLETESGDFCLPGCDFDSPGVDVRDCIRLKLKKDIGIDIETLQLADVVSYAYNQRSYINIVFFASCGSGGKKIELSNVYKRYNWVKLSEVHQYISDSNLLRSLRVEEPGYNEGDVIKSTSGESLLKEATVFTDGGSRGNPGPSAAGFVILNSDNEIVFEGGKYLGVTTNNQAEYQAVKLALEKAYELGLHRLKLKMDSQLIVNQMIGAYKIKNRDLWPIYSNIKCLVEKFDKVTFMHVRREFNKEADSLVNKVLDEEGY